MPEKRERIAVVIPLYNGARFIAQTLEHLLAQTRRPDEIVVIDDNSRDDSARIARSFKGVQVVKNPGKGGGHSRDHGFEVTTSPLICFLDQDDLCSPTHFERLTGILESEQDAVAVAACTYPFHDASKIEFGDDEPGFRGVAIANLICFLCPDGLRGIKLHFGRAYANENPHTIQIDVEAETHAQVIIDKLFQHACIRLNGSGQNENLITIRCEDAPTELHDGRKRFFRLVSVEPWNPM